MTSKELAKEIRVLEKAAHTLYGKVPQKSTRMAYHHIRMALSNAESDLTLARWLAEDVEE